MKLCVVLLTLPMVVFGAMCNNGGAKPGAPNENPILENFDSEVVASTDHGKRVLIKSGDDMEMTVLHMYGDDPYEWGKAHGTLMRKEIEEFIPKVKEYVSLQILNDTKLSWAVELGVDAALDLSYEVTKKYTPSYVMKEIQGIADGSGVHANDIRRVMWLGELTRGSCSMFGAWVRRSLHLSLSFQQHHKTRTGKCHKRFKRRTSTSTQSLGLGHGRTVSRLSLDHRVSSHGRFGVQHVCESRIRGMDRFDYGNESKWFECE